MSTLHDQAMSNVYAQVLKRLLEHFSQSQRASLQLLIQRLLVSPLVLTAASGLLISWSMEAAISTIEVNRVTLARVA